MATSEFHRDVTANLTGMFFTDSVKGLFSGSS